MPVIVHAEALATRIGRRAEKTAIAATTIAAERPRFLIQLMESASGQAVYKKSRKVSTGRRLRRGHGYDLPMRAFIFGLGWRDVRETRA